MAAPALASDYVPLRGGVQEEEDFPGGDPLLDWARSDTARRGTRARTWLARSFSLPSLPQLSASEVLLALILALLAVVVVLLSRDVARGADTTPPVPSQPPSPPGARPLAAWEDHLRGEGYVAHGSASFLTLWAQHSPGATLLIQVPDSLHEKLVLVNAEVSQADGSAYLLHQPLGESFWLLSPSPDGSTLDVRVPALEKHRVEPRSTLAPAAAGGGLFSGAAVTLLRYEAGGSLGSSEAVRGPAARPGFYDATDFLLSWFALADVLGALDVGALEGARLAGVAAHPRNLELEVQGRANGTALGIHMSLVLAPDVPMTPRLADDRAGYFSTCYAALGGDVDGGDDRPKSSQDARRCISHRWRLERAAGSPAGCGAAGGAPKCIAAQAITYHLDPSIPDKWASCFAHGVVAWDKAFTAAGWAPGTVRALRAGDPAWPIDYNATDVRYSSITFAPSLSSVYAVGPSTVDPRTGEIVNADIMFAHSWVAWFLGEWHGLSGGAAPADGGDDAAGYSRVHRGPRRSAQCFHNHGAGGDGGSGVGGLLRAAGEWNGAGAGGLGTAEAQQSPLIPFARVPAPTAEAFVCEALADVTAHEVGHTLGLRHNFAGSAAYSAAQLASPAFLAQHGISASVMDYLPPLMPSNRSAQSYYFGPVVGAYDLWAIAVGYTPSASDMQPAPPSAPDGGAVPASMPAEVEALLSRAAEPELSFCTDDADAGSGGSDPYCSTYDLTSDPVSYYRDRNALMGDAKQRLLERLVAPAGEGGDWSLAYDAAHTLMHTASVSVASGAAYAAKAVGGTRVSAAHWPQVPSPVVAVPAQRQREAIAFILEVLTGDALYVLPRDAHMLTRHGSVSSGQAAYERDALGRLPADILGDARAAKRSIIKSLMAPWRAEALAREAWAGTAASLSALEVLDSLTSGIFGDAMAPLMRNSSSCGDAQTLAAATGQMGAHDGERRALQRLWVQALGEAAAQGSAAGELSAAATAARSELRAALLCLLTHAERPLRAHLLALTGG